MSNFGGLPSDIVLYIASCIEHEKDWENYSLVCKRFHKILVDPFSFASFHIIFSENGFSKETKYYLYGDKDRCLTIELMMKDKTTEVKELDDITHQREREKWHASAKSRDANNPIAVAYEKHKAQTMKRAGHIQIYKQFEINLDDEPYIYKSEPSPKDRMVLLTNSVSARYIYPLLLMKQTGTLQRVQQISFYVNPAGAKVSHGPAVYFKSTDKTESLPVLTHMNLFEMNLRSNQAQTSVKLNMRNEFRMGEQIRSIQYDPATGNIIQQMNKTQQYRWVKDGKMHVTNTPLTTSKTVSCWDPISRIRTKELYFTGYFDAAHEQQIWDSNTGILISNTNHLARLFEYWNGTTGVVEFKSINVNSSNQSNTDQQADEAPVKDNFQPKPPLGGCILS